jgi:hypothetical protein
MVTLHVAGIALNPPEESCSSYARSVRDQQMVTEDKETIWRIAWQIWTAFGLGSLADNFSPT